MDNRRQFFVPKKRHPVETHLAEKKKDGEKERATETAATSNNGTQLNVLLIFAHLKTII